MNKVYLLSTEELSNADIFAREYGRMPVYRQEKINKFRFEKDKRLSLAAGILLNRGLQEAGMIPKQVEIRLGSNGKPYLAETDNVFFSLSHSGCYAMAAFADTEVGCDIEQITSIDEKIARRFFSAYEVRALESIQDEQERQALFFRYWTLKESYLKLTGEGLAMPLDSFEVHLGEPVTIEPAGVIESVGFIESTKKKPMVSFREYEIPDYKVAVCRRICGTSFDFKYAQIEKIRLENENG